MITCRLQIITLALSLFSLMPMHGAEDLATLERTSEAMLQSAFRADNQGTPEEAVAAANASIHAISVAREDRMRPSLLVYPLRDAKSAPKEISLDVQLLSGKTWETAARNVLK